MKRRTRIIAIILMAITLLNISLIVAFANYSYVYVTRDIAWPEKGFNYKEILELYQPSNYGTRTVGGFAYVDGQIVQITGVTRDSQNRISSFTVIDKYGETYGLSNALNNSNYPNVTKKSPNLSNSSVNTIRTVTSSMAIGPFYTGDLISIKRNSSYSNKSNEYRLISRYGGGEVIWYHDSEYGYRDGDGKKVNLNDRDSILGIPSKVPSTFSQSYLNNIEAQGWELVHNYGLISTYNITDSSYNISDISYYYPFGQEWRSSSSSQDDVFGPGIVNRSITTRNTSGTNYVNYGNFGSYNPKLYEHKILLYSSPNSYRVYASAKEEISSQEINIPVGKSFSVGYANWTTSEVQYFVRVYRRYKGETAAVQSVSVNQTGENSFTAVANVTNPGLPEADEHGYIWSTSTSNLTYELAPNKTKLGYRETTGQYSSNITGCLPGVTYYARPYIINELGISYGATQTFKINTPPAVNIVEPTADQFIHKGNTINFRANISDGEGDNITYTIQIGSTAPGSSNLYSGVPNGTKTNTLVTHSYDTSTLPLTWNATANRYEQKVYFRIIANDGKPGGITTKDNTCIVGNYKPGITLTAPVNSSNYGEVLELTGKAWDSFGGKLTISTSIGGKSTSTTLNTSPTIQPASDNYVLRWQGTNVPPEGEYTNIVITVTDEHGGSNSVTLSKITITDVLATIKKRIQEHILLDSGSDLRFLIIDTDTKITESQRNNELLEQIRSMIKNRGTHLFFIGNDNETKNYIQRYLKDIN
ncbi:hypothetical protein [Geosporobacter ferrireducens]|uniref:hypothetical protein n=1 Tax=Geosporobacter ferrireducens TaxID=1424294 RepID=UPI00139DF9CF|nr:hypothetical protein [Geosporobacter ferrireducens]MTI53781.1 hypothetical protein [Geosporobacter ferrireducens]